MYLFIISSMKTSKEGIDFIKKWEGFCPKPYKCTSGVPTIGYGATFYTNGKKVTMQDREVTEVQASGMLATMVANNFEKYVDSYVTAEVNQHQFDAMVSLSYNIGVGAFKKSTLLKKVNVNPNDPSIADEFMRFKYSAGKVSQGLLNRRKEEVAMYYKSLPVAPKSNAISNLITNTKEFLKSLLNS